ncbi:unnamed protein product [Rodentolepis nana]|uniref:FBD domain-containing protein n=1 Tax=Rodentolepis nana TaxID=102285 RepID=A0A0R3U0K6_RODNA|nr:unnamed protein product [Rodentolepis nana]
MASMPRYEVKDSGGQLDVGGWMESTEALAVRGSAFRVSALMVEGTDKEECLLLTYWELLLWLRICRSWCYASDADIDQFQLELLLFRNVCPRKLLDLVQCQ